jgi:hypothetical protein
MPDSDDDVRVDDLWFSDDTLVIKAENRIFRVSKSILAARSSVFSDMVAFPQPVGDDVPVIDGRPVVTLYDTGAEVEVFLRAIFDSRHVTNSLFSFSVVPAKLMITEASLCPLPLLSKLMLFWVFSAWLTNTTFSICFYALCNIYPSDMGPRPWMTTATTQLRTILSILRPLHSLT